MWILFLASNSTLKDIENFLEECSKMKHFSHPNVVPLIGVSFDKENNPAMVLPFMNNGDVKAYLLSQRVSDTDVDTFPPVMHSLFLHMLYIIYCILYEWVKGTGSTF